MNITAKNEWTKAIQEALRHIPPTEEVTGDFLLDNAICYNQDLVDVFDLDPFDEAQIRDYADRCAMRFNDRKES